MRSSALLILASLVCGYAGNSLAQACAASPPISFLSCAPDDDVLRVSTPAGSKAIFAIESNGTMFWGPGGDLAPELAMRYRVQVYDSDNIDPFTPNNQEIRFDASFNGMSRLHWRNQSAEPKAAAAVAVSNTEGAAMLLVTGHDNGGLYDLYATAGLMENEAAVTSDSTLEGLALENTRDGGYIRFVKNTREVARFDDRDNLWLRNHATLDGDLWVRSQTQIDGKLWATYQLIVDGAFRHRGPSVGFYGADPKPKPTITGSRSDGTALASLLQALQQMGLIVDQTVP